MSGPVKEHREAAPRSVTVGIVTASSSRYARSLQGEAVADESGDAVEEVLRRAGHAVRRYGVVDDDVRMIRRTLYKALEEGCDAFVVIGGTGVTSRDVTVEALRPLFDKELPGFGEVFRAESYRRIGGAAMLSRATAGVIRGMVVFAFPGSPDGARLAAEIVAGELPHLVHLARR
ncbi:MAG: MogA/MoaB family molybdenum cofactor biosynthesis protein [Nitrososphaerota archaeon]